VFPFGQHHGTITWCFDDKGSGRSLFVRIDQMNFYCHAQATAAWSARALGLRSTRPACTDGSADAPTELICRNGSQGTLCVDSADANSTDKGWIGGLYRVR
jgi:hypothetical protein